MLEWKSAADQKMTTTIKVKRVKSDQDTNCEQCGCAMLTGDIRYCEGGEVCEYCAESYE